MSVPPNWESEMRTRRQQKDEFFAESPRSPIPVDARAGFDGLRYFPPDPTYRFELAVHEHADKETITVATSTEGEREYVVWGEFRFEVDGETYALQAYKRDVDDRGFWLPFRDETSGEETYGAGRYIDLDSERDRTDDGRWVLDFNEAYNPYCAYSEAYECPLVPMENWLDVEIRAGERAPEL